MHWSYHIKQNSRPFLLPKPTELLSLGHGLSSGSEPSLPAIQRSAARFLPTPGIFILLCSSFSQKKTFEINLFLVVSEYQRLIYLLGGMEGRVDLQGGWLCTEMVCLSACRQSPIQVLSTQAGVEQLCLEDAHSATVGQLPRNSRHRLTASATT